MLPRIRTFAHRAHAVLTKRVRFERYSFPVYVVLALISVVSLISTLASIGRSRRLLKSKLLSHTRIEGNFNNLFQEGCAVPQADSVRANASFVVLARNQELDGVINSMKSLERHFNQWYDYPWVFLNDETFNEEFKLKVKAQTNGDVHFGTIPEELWEFPQDLRQSTEFKESINIQGDRGIMYGDTESYHKMCRFYSGGFYKHEMVRQFEWYWRVEPDVDFYCDITYDPFMEMQSQGKKYGFVIMIKELIDTVPNLFRVTKAWLRHSGHTPKSAWKLFATNYRDMVKMKDEVKYDQLYKNVDDKYSLQSRAREVILLEDLLSNWKRTNDRNSWNTDKSIPEDHLAELAAFAMDRHRLPTLQGEQVDNEQYNLFHFWSNFEIARVDLWDNPLYESYFQYLEKHGGFYKERWGDAPVHSLAVGMLLDLNEVHYFRDFGYRHTTIRHCPANHESSKEVKYTASSEYLQSPAYDRGYDKHWANFDSVKQYGVGCRCRCPTDINDVEDSPEYFYAGWYDLIQEKQQKQHNILGIEKDARKKLRAQGKLMGRRGPEERNIQ